MSLEASVPAADKELVGDLKALVAERPSYGYRRATAMLNRSRRKQGAPRLNHKRIYRVMRDNALLLQRCTGLHPGRVHDGTVLTEKPNTRWCSDTFEIRCWSGERILLGDNCISPSCCVTSQCYRGALRNRGRVSCRSDVRG
ncbi:MAG: IS3 family transposase [Betaproteobacteria bacterium]|nr:IS3 family transposase [Betaproteobacteria bacterium]